MPAGGVKLLATYLRGWYTGGVGDKTGIQWTGHTYNPWQGCEQVSPGCDNCYMFRDMRRYGKDPARVVRSSAQTFNRPLRWNREAAAAGVRQRVFLASWSDFFIKDADEWRYEAWDIIRRCPWLDFQILTKRHGRIADNLPSDWGPTGYDNVWLGVSAENREWWDRRVPVLREIPARVRFVSYEPALGSIAGASAKGISWVIIGGESAPARPFDITWAREALDICRRDGAAPFVKQMGSMPVTPVSDPESENYGERLRLPLVDSHGGDMDEWPPDLRVREFPA